MAARELVELERREHAYRGGRAAVEVAGKTVIVVDDGLATGSTMLAAIGAVRQRGAAYNSPRDGIKHLCGTTRKEGIVHTKVILDGVSAGVDAALLR